MNVNIGKNIRFIRKQKQLTQSELANKMNISRSYLGDLENNRRNPSIETVSALANALDINIDEILKSSNSPNSPNSPNEVGVRISNIRRNLGLSMEELGKRLDTSKGAVNNWEKGINFPNKERLKKITELGNVSMGYLLYGKEDSQTNQEVKMLRKENLEMKEKIESYEKIFGNIEVLIASQRDIEI